MATTTAPRVTLGDLIKRARKDAGLEQDDLAKAVGVSRSGISYWERDKSQPSFGQMRRIIQATKADWLLTEPFREDEKTRTGWSTERAGQKVGYVAA